MHLAIIIPCLNEEKTIATVIDAIPKKIKGIASKDIIVVDDGSTDATPAIAKEKGAHVVSHATNQGVGKAFQTGLSAALDHGADIIVNMDGDGQFNPKDIPTLIAPILAKEADFATASRFMKKEFVPTMPGIKKWGNRRIAGLVSFLVGKKFYDVSCGFRAYSQEAALQMNLFGKFTYTQETFLDLAFKDIKMVEVPLQIRGVREFGKSRVASNLWRYAVNSSKIIFRTFRDYKPMRFFGGFALSFFLAAAALLAFFIRHRVTTGSFSPHLWAGFTGAGLGMVGLFLFITGLLADMLDRLRKNQEKLLYYERRRTIADAPKRKKG